MKWLYITAIVIALGIMGYSYVSLNMSSHDSTSEATTTSPQSILITHAFKDNEHRFTGQIRLPHSCYAFTAEAVHDPNRQNVIVIILKATDKNLPESQCSKLPTNYPFEVLAEGAADATIEATLNDEELKTVIKDTEWQSSTGTYFTPISN